ncbi:hypothetical protein N7540_011020 [Penicillium herquei]|nr:hypothetical protein N7540_011020 [Penicillium herquei]
MKEKFNSEWRILVEETPSLTKHDWRSAEKFWEVRDSNSWIQKWMDSIARDASFLMSIHDFETWPTVWLCRRSSLKARSEVKKFRQNLARGDTSSESMKQTREVVYEHYARAMNNIESLTGRITDRVKSRRNLLTLADYRFPYFKA